MACNGFLDPAPTALFTDLYELTMLQAYYAENLEQPAVFELFCRQLPRTRNYILACGLEEVLTYLEHLRFSETDLTYLRGREGFSEAFLARLAAFRFTGDVYAVPEGTVVFAHEPLVQVVAPLPEAQLVETFLLNQIHFQSVVASKAARVVTAASGRTVVDFGSRRAHGTDAAMKVARASYLAGAAGTSNVLAGRTYGIPLFGTMAHSYVQAHDDERQAFGAFASLYPETTLLVDTYDALAGVRKVIALSRRLGETFRVRAIRLDSGDLNDLAVKARRMLDEAGLTAVRIFASGGLDEYKIAALVRADAPIDGFGVGTRLAVAHDAPDLDFAYKLVEYAGRPRTKLSAQKIILPGRKQVFRTAEAGRMVRDVVGPYDEASSGQPLLVPVMRDGTRIPGACLNMEQARNHARDQIAQLPEALREIEPIERPYALEISSALMQGQHRA